MAQQTQGSKVLQVFSWLNCFFVNTKFCGCHVGYLLLPDDEDEDEDDLLLPELPELLGV
jgi:hypothetical protein